MSRAHREVTLGRRTGPGGTAGAYITRYNLLVANPVRELREAAGLSQVELARRSGVAQPNIAAYETRRRRISPEMLRRLRSAVRPLPHEALVAHRDELVRLAERYELSNVRVFWVGGPPNRRPRE